MKALTKGIIDEGTKHLERPKSNMLKTIVPITAAETLDFIPPDRGIPPRIKANMMFMW